MATPNYDINYNDKRFQNVESDKKEALSELEKTYAGMINNSDKYYQAQIDASKQWAETQKKNQQAQTDFAIEQIEQQKDKANKDYIKEQSGSYIDWQKQSNAYGANAEQMAAAGLAGSGFSESSQVSLYNTYQARITAARESYNQAVLNYNNAIKDARLQNNSALAEIAYQALQTQLELSLQGFQYKNQLIIEKANKKTELDNNYYQRYQDVLNQINTENALAEEVRQYNQNYQLQVDEFKESIRQYNQSYQLKLKEFNEGIRQFNEEIARLKAQDAAANAREIQKLELQKQQLEEEKRQFNATMAAKAAKSSGSSGSSGGTVKKSGGSGTVKKSSGKSVPTVGTVKSTKKTSGADYLNALIASGASKDKVSNEIALALRNGAITKAEATKLRQTFTPRGYTY